MAAIDMPEVLGPASEYMVCGAEGVERPSQTSCACVLSFRRRSGKKRKQGM